MWYLGPDPNFGEMSAVHSDQLSLYERGSSFPTSIRGHLNVVIRERETKASGPSSTSSYRPKQFESSCSPSQASIGFSSRYQEITSVSMSRTEQCLAGHRPYQGGHLLDGPKKQFTPRSFLDRSLQPGPFKRTE